MRSAKRTRSASLLACLFLWSSLAASCRTQQPGGQAATPAATEPISDRALVQLDAQPGLTVRLSEGKPGAGEQRDRVKVAPAVRLAEARAQGLLARLPALAAESGDKKDFALRDKSQPPPRTGKVIKGSFPPATSGPRPPSPAVEKKPLEVVRIAPEGDVPLAPHLSVTFNQPMVAITSHADTTADGVPVALTPQPRGTWRWIGSKTLLFDPEVRFPAATEYSVQIAAGTRSAAGAVLKKPVTVRFATPAPKLTQRWPQDGQAQPRDPLLFAAFDQKIDPAEVLASIRLEADGGHVRVRAASEKEIAADPDVERLIQAEIKAEHQGRYVAFKPVSPLPGDRPIQVAVGPGTPSAEGPRKTTSAQGWGFRTFGPLEVVESHCGGGRDCPPGMPFAIRLSNPLDEEAFDQAALRIEPELRGLKAVAGGAWLTIQGLQKGRTTYEVTLPSSLRDKFGQTLGADKTIRFRVGDAWPQLHGATGLTLLDPSSKRRTYNLHSINVPSLDVEIYRVSPDDWPDFVRHMEKNPRRPVRPPGTKVSDRTVKVAGSPDELVETAIDLAPALSRSGKGHAVVVVKPTRWSDRYKPELSAWVEATEIALDAFVDAGELLAWTTRLGDGAPMQGVELSLQGIRGSTGARGTAALALPVKSRARQILVGRKGDDVAFLPENPYAWSEVGGWRKQKLDSQLAWFVYDDRAMYRPGETVHLKGWLRVLDPGERGDVMGLAGQVDQVSYKVIGPRGNDLTSGTARVSALGGFDAAFTLPKTPNLGAARVELRARGKKSGVHSHGFQIQEFRRPEYEVSAEASEGPHLLGRGADISIEAAYYAGGGLANADVTWEVTSSPAQFTPPGRDGYVFGTFEPWWTHRYDQPDQSRAERLSGKTDATGRHTLHVDFLSIVPPRPMSMVATGYVQDVNRQSWAASSALLVHPSDLYVGLKQDRLFVDRGQPIRVAAIAVDQEGKFARGAAIDMKAVRLDWTYKKGEFVEEEADPQSCRVVAANQDQLCTFDTPEGGTYRISATVVDRAGRPNQSQIMVWVAGGDTPPSRNVAQEEAMIVPDAKEYRPGKTARLLVQSPFFPAQGLLSIRRSGIVETRAFEMKSATTTLEVPIREAHVPNLTVQVDLVGSAARMTDDGKRDNRLPRRPAYAKGTLDLSVPPVNRSLRVAVAPRVAKIEPGGKTQVDVAVKDASGRAVAGAELAVVVVDEAVLALTSYKTPDPLAAFYAHREAGVRDHHLRQYVALARPDLAALAQTGGGGKNGGRARLDAAPGATDTASAEPSAAPAPERAERMMKKSAEAPKELADEEKSGARPAPPAQQIALRKQFGALAVFAPQVRTDAGGRASVAVAVPDNLTRYRIMVAAVAGEKQFGAGESSVTARMPLMVRPSPPRFLNFGDRFELPVVLQNQTDRAMPVELAVRATNAALTAGSGRRVTVPANDRVEVRMPAAAEMAGTARFQIAAASGRLSDAAEVALPVWTPATSEAFAVYGEIDRGAIRQEVSLPKDAIPRFGGLEVSTSSTQLQALTDAVLYLVAYPYECAEQISSRVLAVAALRDVLSAFRAEGLPSAKELERAVARDIDKLRALQNDDGGFAFWVRGHESWPYLSIHAGHALARAKDKGFDVPARMIEQSRAYLKSIEQHLPGYYPPEVKRTLRAYAVYVRKRMGDRDLPEAHRILREAGGADKLPLEAVGWLYATMTGDAGSDGELRAIRRLLDNRATETAATAHFATGYKDGGHLLLESDRRADGILLEALIEDAPRHDLVPKLVRGLLAHRTAGHWNNTQENAFVLLAMDRYFRTYEKVTPDFVARAWLGDGHAGDHRFRGRQTDQHHIDIPMSYLAGLRGGVGDLVLAKEGKGRLYYRIGMTYAPRSLWLAPADHGFAVERFYEPVDNPRDVVRGKDGTWHIKAGAQVRVRLTMVSESRRYHVALVDPLPAGLEPMNPALAVTGSIPQDPCQVPPSVSRGACAQGPLRGPKARGNDDWWWWTRTWYEHQNMRDERVEAFTSLLWEGVHDYTYVARATTPGRFVVPPTRAEEMYSPETFGRSASDRVIIE